MSLRPYSNSPIHGLSVHDSKEIFLKYFIWTNEVLMQIIETYTCISKLFVIVDAIPIVLFIFYKEGNFPPSDLGVCTCDLTGNSIF